MNVPKAQLPKANERLTRLSLILGITVWFVDLNTVYALPSLACNWSWFPFTIAGIPGLVFVEGMITLIDLLLMLYLIYLPWRNWRAFQTEKPKDNPRMLHDTEMDRRSLMAFVAMLLNSFFFLFIIAFFIPMITLNACVQG
jgi:hypothetical protein